MSASIQTGDLVEVLPGWVLLWFDHDEETGRVGGDDQRLECDEIMLVLQTFTSWRFNKRWAYVLSRVGVGYVHLKYVAVCT